MIDFSRMIHGIDQFHDEAHDDQDFGDEVMLQGSEDQVRRTTSREGREERQDRVLIAIEVVREAAREQQRVEDQHR